MNKRFFLSLLISALSVLIFIYPPQSLGQSQKDNQLSQTQEAKEEPAPRPEVFLEIDKKSLKNGGIIMITGKVPEGKPVYIEIWTDEKVRATRLDAEVDKETGKRPYIFYMTDEMPAFYNLLFPKEFSDVLESEKQLGRKWSVSTLLRNTGATTVFDAPAQAKIDRYQTTLWASIIGSRGELLPPMDKSENKRRAMQLVKAKFRDLPVVFKATIEINPDGTFKVPVELPSNAPPGKYYVVAKVDKDLKSEKVVFENTVSFPSVYLDNAGRTVNLFIPFFLTMAITTFGVLMGAGGGFILNPILVMLGLPHTVVAGTVMPTVLFSQGSGIINYSRIKFISWQLGVTLGLAMLAGGFIGPKLTELITLDQYKFLFGWVLIILAALMFWQTTPKYLEKNKKEQAILKEFQRRAQEATQKKEEGGK
ncbi:MAG: sulfite exporter TauE/SafE family protein [Thermodesulfovibrionales bacterium]|nr:sulfite exporter TauE/SafE family protein [Thermodesulfovibrionales bacterium]